MSTLDKTHKLYALVAPTFRIAPEKIRLPHLMPYDLHQVATDRVTGDVFFIVTSDTPEGLQAFREDFNNPRTVNNPRQLAKRSDWKMNMFPTLDDGQSDFEDIIRAGISGMKVAAEERLRRREAGAQINRLTAIEEEAKRKQLKMYEGEPK